MPNTALEITPPNPPRPHLTFAGRDVAKADLRGLVPVLVGALSAVPGPAVRLGPGVLRHGGDGRGWAPMNADGPRRTRMGPDGRGWARGTDCRARILPEAAAATSGTRRGPSRRRRA